MEKRTTRLLICKRLAITILILSIITPLLSIQNQQTTLLSIQNQQTTMMTTIEGQKPETTRMLSSTPIVEWSYTTGGYIAYSSPAVADVDRDGKMEVVISSNDYKVYCLSRTGGLEWSYATSSDIYSSPAVADVDGDNQLEVVVGSLDNNIYCLSGTGGREWIYETQGCIDYSSPAVADVDGDNQLEVVCSGVIGVYCITGTGVQKWAYFPGNDFFYSSPAVADVDGDNQLELVVGSKSGNIYCLSGTGVKEWSYTTGGAVYSSPAVADVDDDNKLEIIVGSIDHNIYCLNGIGELEWSYTTGDEIYLSSPAVADVDGDNKLEIIVGSMDFNIYCLSGTGVEEWSYTTGERVYSSPAVADVDSDNKLEIIVGSMDHRVYCLSVVSAPFDPSAYPWPSIGFRGDISHSGCFVDTDGDGLTDRYEVTVGTNIAKADTDSDGLTDNLEFLSSTNPFINLPPAAVTDLTTSDATNTSITLTWTAPGSEGNIGTASGYIVKYSLLGPITETNWASAITYSQSWLPLSADNKETHLITGLNPSTQYWFAIKAYDEVPNYSAISNSPSGTTQGGGEIPLNLPPVALPPAAVTDLTTSDATNTSITLTWTASGSEGNIGTASGYIVKYSLLGPITKTNWTSATTYSQSWIPLSAGSKETHLIIGLNTSTQYWFAIKAYDEVPNYSAISNSPSGTTQGGIDGGGIFLVTLSIIASVVLLIFLMTLVYVRRKKVVTEGVTGINEIWETSHITPVRETSPEEVTRIEEAIVPKATWEVTPIAQEVAKEAPSVMVPSTATLTEKCIICWGEVKKSDIVAQCPFCGILGHRDHILEWIHTHNNCPRCLQDLNEEDLRIEPEAPPSKIITRHHKRHHHKRRPKPKSVYCQYCWAKLTPPFGQFCPNCGSFIENENGKQI